MKLGTPTRNWNHPIIPFAKSSKCRLLLYQRRSGDLCIYERMRYQHRLVSVFVIKLKFYSAVRIQYYVSLSFRSISSTYNMKFRSVSNIQLLHIMTCHVAPIHTMISSLETPGVCCCCVCQYILKCDIVLKWRHSYLPCVFRRSVA